MKRVKKADAEKSRMRALFCFEKSAELAISYVQELEKSMNSQASKQLLVSQKFFFYFQIVFYVVFVSVFFFRNWNTFFQYKWGKWETAG